MHSHGDSLPFYWVEIWVRVAYPDRTAHRESRGTAQIPGVAVPEAVRSSEGWRAVAVVGAVPRRGGTQPFRKITNSLSASIRHDSKSAYRTARRYNMA
jgi:hypothetical protein